jgi:hypothetical protein
MSRHKAHTKLENSSDQVKYVETASCNNISTNTDGFHVRQTEGIK